MPSPQPRRMPQWVQFKPMQTGARTILDVVSTRRGTRKRAGYLEYRHFIFWPSNSHLRRSCVAQLAALHIRSRDLRPGYVASRDIEPLPSRVRYASYDAHTASCHRGP